MRIRNMAIYFTAGVLWFPQQCISTQVLQLLLFVLAPPAAARREGMWGHPTPRQRASPSALPFYAKVGEGSGIFRTPAKGFAFCTPVLCEMGEGSGIFHTPAKGFTSALSTHRDLTWLLAIWPGATRSIYLVQMCADQPSLLFAWH